MGAALVTRQDRDAGPDLKTLQAGRPFVKWAGGKMRLLPEVLRRIPQNFRTFHEPFVGGGAVFFALAPRRTVLNDISPDLVNAYRVVQGQVDALIAELSSGQYRNDKETYLQVRAQDPEALGPATRAARFIYLNHTCFNGLWRVNSHGEFNVPYGGKPNTRVFDETALRRASDLLAGAAITQGDFSYVEAVAQAGDVVYMDPPYDPVSRTANFTAYIERRFTPEDQVRVASVAAVLARRGVKVIVSNSDTPFIRDLYQSKRFRIETVEAPRAISADGSKRGCVPELIITF
jgi:DNA adenine methylase